MYIRKPIGYIQSQDILVTSSYIDNAIARLCSVWTHCVLCTTGGLLADFVSGRSGDAPVEPGISRSQYNEQELTCGDVMHIINT